VVNLYYRLTFRAMSYSTWVHPMKAAGMRRRVLGLIDRAKRGKTKTASATNNIEFTLITNSILLQKQVVSTASANQATKPGWRPQAVRARRFGILVTHGRGVQGTPELNRYGVPLRRHNEEAGVTETCHGNLTNC
jgi:hypothetical protein